MLPGDMSAADQALVVQISEVAARANDGQQVRHVGRIFERLEHLFAEVLADDDFWLDAIGRQAREQDWGFEPRTPEDGEKLRIATFLRWIDDGKRP